LDNEVDEVEKQNVIETFENGLFQDLEKLYILLVFTLYLNFLLAIRLTPSRWVTQDRWLSSISSSRLGLNYLESA